MDRIRLAVTTVLLRERHGQLEVLLVRRPESMAAFAGMWVFPGGQVDPADDQMAARAVLDAGAQSHAARPCLAPDPSCTDPPLLPLFTAACRELFEEVGVLFAAPADGSPLPDQQLQACLARRPAMLADSTAFYEELAARGLRLELSRLVPWSRWITPPARTRRFDTVFFVAAAGDESLAPEAREIAEACWLPVEQAISQGTRGIRRLMAPTILTLMQVATARSHHGSLAGALAEGSKALLTPVHPHTVVVEGESWIVFPWEDGGDTGVHAWRTSGTGGVPGRLRAEY